MSSLLSSIRFLCMTVHEIDSNLIISSILTVQEKERITRNKVAFMQVPLPLWCSGITRERNYMTCQVYFCCYFGKVPNRNHIYSHSIECTVRVNKEASLVGVSFYIHSWSITSKDVRLTVFNEDKLIACGMHSKYNREGKFLQLFLREPVLLKENECYTVRAHSVESLILCGSRIRKTTDNWEYLFDVNPHLVQGNVAWESHPHFRCFLYRVAL